MLDPDIINPALLARRQVQVLRLDESLVQQRLLHVLFVEFLLARVLKQVLEEVFHDTVFDAFAVEGPLVLIIAAGSPILLRREYFHELISHFAHKLLHKLALLLARTVFLYELGQRAPDESLDGLADRGGLRALEFLVEGVKNTLRIATGSRIAHHARVHAFFLGTSK